MMMKRQTIAGLARLVRLSCAVATVGFVALSPRQGRTDEAVFNVSNPYTDVHWATVTAHTGNLHSHTTQSDGQHSPAGLIDDYHGRGYKVLAITDHNTVTHPWSTFGRDPATLGMIDVQGNELSSGNHIASLFCDYASSSPDEGSLLAGVAAAGGISFFAHPGRYSRTARWFADHYLAQPTCVGMEIHNQGDRYSGDRAKWDAVLSILMPNRPVWAVSNDDTHQAAHVGRNRNYYLLDTLSHASVRDATVKGQFFATYSTSSTHVSPAITNVAFFGSVPYFALAGGGTVPGAGTERSAFAPCTRPDSYTCPYTWNWNCDWCVRVRV